MLIGSDLQVSIAYADDIAVIAWGTNPVGIDIERTDAQPPEGMDVLAWTRLEALGKAAGTGVRTWPQQTPPELTTEPLDLPDQYVGTVAGNALGWRLIAPRPA
ncbi:hypothetical protein Back2_22210 [Nocardioides baekrokdamisoli]|uniref:Uncharacterized protein n=1 Tax=Nocardioides baekrokdamisoli TaxID=1804624 RepID=A0A3G9J3D1_9ACTN|nr:hypothetical protein Back2_22210 [Nocardioides baekrokdamisoli]